MRSKWVEEVGYHIRTLRQRRGLTLRELSKQCGLSISFLSQIERGLSSLSIPSLSSICQALDVSLTEMLLVTDGSGRAFLVDPRPPEITKGDNQSYINLSDASIKYRFLSGGFPSRQFEALIGEMSPGSHNPPCSHEGEEFGYVLEGRIKLTIGDDSHELSPGDSYHILATTQHGCQTNDEEGAKVLWVQTARYAKSLSFFREEDFRTQRRGFSQVKSSNTNEANPRSQINLSDMSVKYRFLSGDFLDRHFEIRIGEMSPSCQKLRSSYDGEEFGYVLEGRLKLTIDEECYNLGPGDSYHLLSATPHFCETDNQEGAKVLWAQTAQYLRMPVDVRDKRQKKQLVGSRMRISKR
jgi:quercetin dioxygenase-like cupin family protein/DNA-binding Xre family transcriptional regulator